MRVTWCWNKEQKHRSAGRRTDATSRNPPIKTERRSCNSVKNLFIFFNLQSNVCKLGKMHIVLDSRCMAGHISQVWISLPLPLPQLTRKHEPIKCDNSIRIYYDELNRLATGSGIQIWTWLLYTSTSKIFSSTDLRTHPSRKYSEKQEWNQREQNRKARSESKAMSASKQVFISISWSSNTRKCIIATSSEASLKLITYTWHCMPLVTIKKAPVAIT